MCRGGAEGEISNTGKNNKNKARGQKRITVTEGYENFGKKKNLNNKKNAARKAMKKGPGEETQTRGLLGQLPPLKGGWSEMQTEEHLVKKRRKNFGK